MKRGQIVAASQGPKKRDRELEPVLERRSSLLTSLVERARKVAVGTNVSFPDTFSLPASSLDDVLRDLGGESSASVTLFTAVMSDDERDELELTFSKGDKRHQLVEKLIRRKFDAFTNFVRLHCGENLVPGEEMVDRILSAVSGSQPDEGTGDEAVTPEKPMKKKQQGARKQQKESKKREVAVVVAAERSRVSPKIVKKKKVEEEEAEEEEEEEEKPDGKLSREDVLVLMKLAEAKYDEIVELAKAGKAKVDVSFVKIKAPEPGKLVAMRNLNAEVLRACLCDEEPLSIASIEGLGILLLWWRIVDRACRMRAIFIELRSRQSRAKIRDRYEELTRSIPQTTVGFVQASRYERLGGFLVEFPQFVFQSQLVTVADWFQLVEGEKGVLLDVLPSIVPLSSVFLKDRFELHRDGFVVYPSVLKDLVSDELVALCKAHFDNDAGEYLFNNHRDVGSRPNDGLRLQRSIDAGELGENEMAMRLKRAIIETLKREHLLHRVKGDKSMVSRENCKAHTDFSEEPVKNSDERMPLACFVALMDDTAFDVWLGAIRFDESRKIKPLQVRLNAGDMLVFRGDLVHGGAAVGERENVRIHAYIDVEGVIRPKEHAIDETCYMYDKKHILPRPKK